VSPKKILKKILEFHQAQTPLFASPNILAVSEFNKSSKNIQLEAVHFSNRYPNNALIVHDSSKLELRLLEMLSDLKREKNG